MPLVLHLATNDPALGGDAARRIEVAERLTIGRGPGNDLVLADPNRYLSKNHCVIDAVGGAYTITDTSANGVFLNDSPERLPRDAPVPLSEGTVLRLGGYQITVTAIAPALGARSSLGGGAAPHAAAIDDGIFGDPLAEPDDAAGADALPLRSTPRGGRSPIGAEDEFGIVPPGASRPFGPLIPDDADLFGHKPVDDNWRGASQPDHAPSDQAFFAPPKASAEKIPEDWEMSLGSPSRHAGEAAFRIPDDEPAFSAPGAARPIPTEIGGSQPGPASAALASFLAAAGLGGTTLSEAEKIRLMQVAGAALAATVTGLSEILAARASTKQEFRIERTMIGAADNNPLKFADSPEAALRIMLLGRTPGFLPAKAAIEEALGDIKSHQLAVLAAMQLALRTVIARFDPARLEQRLEQGSLIEGILPGARKARYWELFRALYKEIASELEDDFQKVFGAEFARAYKDQLDRR